MEPPSPRIMTLWMWRIVIIICIAVVAFFALILPFAFWPEIFITGLVTAEAFFEGLLQLFIRSIIPLIIIVTVLWMLWRKVFPRKK